MSFKNIFNKLKNCINVFSNKKVKVRTSSVEFKIIRKDEYF